MCGIAGIIDKKKSVNPEILISMRDALVHRGPDSEGLWISKENDVGLAHRRLSIIDLSEKATQPMFSEDKRYVLVFNGEIYNYKELRKQLRAEGYGFCTESDTEVLLKALIAWGRDTLLRIHGPFAFAFCDNSEKRFIVARDRIGEKPLYYINKPGFFSFASELKALEKIPEFSKEVNKEALVDYLTFGYISSPKSIWKDVYKLEPGQYIEADYRGSIKVSSPLTYWTLSITPDKNIDEEVCKGKFRELMQDVSKEMLVSDVPLGVFLSGGVDSSGVVASLGTQDIKPDTFTIGFMNDKNSELNYAESVSQLFNTNHTEKILSPDDLAQVFYRLVNVLDEPFNDFSYLPTYYVTKEARKNMTVCLSGDGGDELFCGYSKYPKTAKLQNYNRFIPGVFRKSIAKSISMVLKDYSDYKRQVDRTGYDSNTFLFDMLAIVFKPKELLKIAGPELKNILKDYSPGSVVRDKLNASSNKKLDLVNKLRILDIKMTLAEDMLVKVDRMSMINSLEVRPVLLHPKIIDFALRLPRKFLVKKGHAKYILKRAFEKWLPGEILYRKKMGFGPPLSKWFFGDLKEILRQGLENLPEGWFNREAIEALLDDHLKGQRDYIMQIHSLVFLGLWLKSKDVKI